MTFVYPREFTDLPEMPSAGRARRAVDLALAGAGLLLAGPFMLLVAWAIRIETGPPVFFSQTRLGRLGREFQMYKFRKFRDDCGNGDCPVTVEDDRRLTRLGDFLARTKIDELPQLWNILKGDMSVVGPRPESLDLADCFVGPYRRVLQYKPGIFGANQTFFRSEASLYPKASDPEEFYRQVLFPLKVRLDLAYFPYRTFWWDLRWIVFGVLAVFGLRAALPPALDAMLTEACGGEARSPAYAARERLRIPSMMQL